MMLTNRTLGVGFVATALLLFASADALAQARGATLRQRIDQRGDLVFVSNSILTCRASGDGAAACTRAQTSGGTQNDNDFRMIYIDIDSDSSTFNSSAASLALPAGASVSWAGLYWMCTIGRGATNTTPPNESLKNQVAFKVPGGAYSTLTADSLDDGLLNPSPQGYGRAFLGFKDVTASVQGAGSGEYVVGNMQCGHDTSNIWGGWTLAVIYSDPTASLRTISLYDAYDQYTNGKDVTLTPSGFLTPPSGPVNSRVGIVVGDGDAGYTPDSLTLQGTALSNALNPANNIANSTISRFGLAVTNRRPAYVNVLGYDSDILETTNALPNGATSATVVAHSGFEDVFIGLISFSTEIFAPALDTQPAGGKTVVDVNGGKVLPGDVLEYTIGIKNTGQDAAIDARFSDPIPPNTTYLPGSLKVDGVTVTDGADGDVGEYVAVNSSIVARLGTGATGTAGGRIAVDATVQVTFRVTINSPLANGTVISNQASYNYAGETLGLNGTRFSGLSDGDLVTPGTQATKVTVEAAPVIITTLAGSYTDTNMSGGLDPGEEVRYVLTVTNVGNDTGHGVHASIPLDPNLTLVSATLLGGSADVTTTNSSVAVAIGDLQIGDTFTVEVEVRATVNAPFPQSAGGQVSVQARTTADNSDPVLSDDPSTPDVVGDPTVLHVATGCECHIDGSCYGVDAKDPANACQKCTPSLSTTAWSPVSAGGSCNDGKACTTGDVCDGSGTCSGTLSCDDGLTCTTGSCGDTGACVQTTSPTACVIDGTCVAADAKKADNACLACRPSVSQTGWSPVDSGTGCDDGKFCTTGDACNGNGVCLGTARVCDDGLGCTADSCDLVKDACVATVNPTSCLIGGVCYASGATNPAAQCQACNPGKSQTDWSSAQKGTPCSDGALCTDDVCDGSGTCVSTTRSCVDAVSCTIDACNPETGDCTHQIPPATCVVEDVCVGTGTVDPNDSCQICDPARATNGYVPAPKGTTCDDGLACTTNDSCNVSGVCVGKSTCDDGISCTLDRCTADGCESRLAPGWCFIGSTCAIGGSTNPADDCQVCVPATSTSAWTPKSGCTHTADAGVLPDAASGGEIDAAVGGEIDAAVVGQIDAAVVGQIDAAVAPDARPDAAVLPPDAATDTRPDAAGADARPIDAPTADARTGIPIEPKDTGEVAGGGCACSTTSRSPADALSALLLALGVVVLRRRSRR